MLSPTPSSRRILVALLAVLTTAVAAVLTACGRPPEPAPDLAPDASSYVAVGDSFVSGPGIQPQDPAGGICLRSSVNWPALVASTLALDLADVSCAGATTGHLTREVPVAGGVVPAQLDAVTASTDLVTLGIGANDGNLFGELVGACMTATKPSPAACADFVRRTLPSMLETVVDRVVDVVGEARERAPHAAVVLVGYLRIAPGSGGCASLPFVGDDAISFAAAERELDRALASAARAAAVRYVSGWQVGADHDVCSAVPWVNGMTLVAGQGDALHPRADGMRAVADAVVAAVRP